MLPVIHVFGTFQIGLYGTIFMLAFLGGVLLARQIRHKEAEKEDILFSALFALIGMGIGMKLLFFITRISSFIGKWDIFCEIWSEDWLLALEEAGTYLFGGNVFYGGLIGAALGLYIYCRMFKIPMRPLIDLFSVIVPLVHGFGRIGCFMAGCCYGIEYHGFGAIQFPDNEFIPELSAVPRFPTQLTEAFCNWIFFGIALYLYRTKKLTDGRLVGAYVLYYSIFRFCIEYVRGDVERGGIGIFSTSQIVSLILLPISILILMGKIMPKKKEADTVEVAE